MKSFCSKIKFSNFFKIKYKQKFFSKFRILKNTFVYRDSVHESKSNDYINNFELTDKTNKSINQSYELFDYFDNDNIDSSKTLNTNNNNFENSVNCNFSKCNNNVIMSNNFKEINDNQTFIKSNLINLDIDSYNKVLTKEEMEILNNLELSFTINLKTISQKFIIQMNDKNFNNELDENKNTSVKDKNFIINNFNIEYRSIESHIKSDSNIKNKNEDLLNITSKINNMTNVISEKKNDYIKNSEIQELSDAIMENCYNDFNIISDSNISYEYECISDSKTKNNDKFNIVSNNNNKDLIKNSEMEILNNFINGNCSNVANTLSHSNISIENDDILNSKSKIDNNKNENSDKNTDFIKIQEIQVLSDAIIGSCYNDADIILDSSITDELLFGDNKAIIESNLDIENNNNQLISKESDNNNNSDLKNDVKDIKYEKFVLNKKLNNCNTKNSKDLENIEIITDVMKIKFELQNKENVNDDNSGLGLTDSLFSDTTQENTNKLYNNTRKSMRLLIKNSKNNDLSLVESNIKKTINLNNTEIDNNKSVEKLKSECENNKIKNSKKKLLGFI